MIRRLVPALLFIMIGLSTTSATAQDATQAADAERPRFTVQVDPLTTALGFVHVQIEYAFTDHLSIYAGPHLRLFNGLISEPEEDYMGIGAEVGVRYFFAASAPQGWWAQVRGVGAQVSTDRFGQEESAFGGYVSALGGYTWIFNDLWVVAAGLGVQYIKYQVAGQGPKGVLPAAHTTIGFAF